jgi:hypothetical protein
MVIQAINTRVMDAHGYSPAQIMFGPGIVRMTGISWLEAKHDLCRAITVRIHNPGIDDHVWLPTTICRSYEQYLDFVRLHQLDAPGNPPQS